MFGDLDKYIAVFLTGLVVTYLFTPLVRVAACRFGVVDLPNERRPHKHPTARGGGLAVIIGVQAACMMALLFPWPNKLAGGLDLHWWQHFTLASLVLLAVGLVDDIRGLRPWVKLGGQVLAALLMCLSGARFGTILGFELPWFLDCVLVIFWLVAIINAFNLIDGLDGLASGLAIISAIGLCGIFLLGNMPANVLVLLGLIGACLGFLRYNFYPATIFLGDTGSMFLGFLLGVISLQTFTKSTFILSLTIPMLVLGVPIYDALLAIWRRSVRLWLSGSQPGAAKPGGIMQPDLEHLHHRLLKSGLSTRRVATVLCVLNGVLVVFGLLITIFKSHAAGIFLLALLAGVYVLMRHLAIIELRDTGRAVLTGLRRPTYATFKSLCYSVWDMVWLAGSIAVAMWAFEPPRPNFWHYWFLDLPVWVTPTFSILAASRIYLTVWTRARVLDVLMLLSMLLLGLFISLGIAMLIDPSDIPKWLVRTLVMGALSYPAILGMRMFYRVVEELVIYFRSKSDEPAQGERVVLYGAGGRCQLFLKERGFHNSSSYDGRAVVGLLDDEPSLHSQWVYGYLVLGGIKDLPYLIERHRITGVVITATLPPAARVAVQELALKHGLHLSEWCFDERKLDDRILQ
jgi:UDP-N-acetylmuramyl pentapeptide phosphotransferase/UDP-N-acetylglucosamine-1-phosphate transferase